MGNEKKIKPWNTDSASITDDESIFIDYEDRGKTIPCSAKFKTKDLKLWITRHKVYYKDEDALWEEKSTFHQMKFKPGNPRQLVVKFYKSSRLVFAQSKEASKWAKQDVDEMKMIDEETTFVKKPPTAEIPDAKPKSTKGITEKDKDGITDENVGTGSKEKKTIKKNEDSAESEEPPIPLDMATFTDALQRLEAVFVDTVKKAYDEKDKAQKDTYLKEIDHLKIQNEQAQEQSRKEVSFLKTQMIEKENAFVAEKERLVEENGKVKQRADRLQSQYDKLKKEYDALLQAQSSLKEKSLVETEAISKEKNTEKQEKENLQKEMKRKNEEVERQKAELIKIRKDMEKLDEQARRHREELSTAHDEIIALKTTIGSAQIDSDQFSPASKTSERQDEQSSQPNEIYFKGANDPLSNMFFVEKGLNLYTHVFYYAETAYQWRSAIFAQDFDTAEKIMNSKDGYEAKEVGKKIEKPPGWYELKESVMAEILDEKYEKCPEYRESLRKSNNAELIENTSDDYWARGTYAAPGLNKLGKLHMKKRDGVASKEQVAVANDTDQSRNDNNYQSTTKSNGPQQLPSSANIEDVLLIGNSHTSHNFRLTHLNRAVKVEKRSAMTIGQAKKEVESETRKRGVIILHELTNDIGQNEAEAVKCSNEYFDVARSASNKAEKVIVSLGLPRNDDATKHQLTQMINWSLRTRLQGVQNVIVCEHDNMLHYGRPNVNYLGRDGYHLSTMGKVMFSKNLVRSIHKATGLPSPISNAREQNDQRLQNNQTPNSRGGGNYKNYDGNAGGNYKNYDGNAGGNYKNYDGNAGGNYKNYDGNAGGNYKNYDGNPHGNYNNHDGNPHGNYNNHDGNPRGNYNNNHDGHPHGNYNNNYDGNPGTNYNYDGYQGYHDHHGYGNQSF